MVYKRPREKVQKYLGRKYEEKIKGHTTLVHAVHTRLAFMSGFTSQTCTLWLLCTLRCVYRPVHLDV